MADPVPHRKARPRKDLSAKSAKVRKKNVKPVEPKKHRPSKPEGRIAADIAEESVEWFLQPWIALGTLTFIAGISHVGKSTFLAYLVAKARRTCILPGYEETIGVKVISRLKRQGADLTTIQFLDTHRYRLPKDERRLINQVKGWGANLLIVDPVDSYMEEDACRNTGDVVRPFLESFASVAEATGAAIVGVRHVGKDVTNIMPGSTEWRNVPRSIMVLRKDSSIPPKYYIIHDKSPSGPVASPCEYRLDFGGGVVPQFVLGEMLDRSVADLAESADTPTGRRRVLEACHVIRHLFTDMEEVMASDLLNECRKLGIGDNARDEAKRLLGVEAAPVEKGGKWRLFRQSKEWPTWLVMPEETGCPPGTGGN